MVCTIHRPNWLRRRGKSSRRNSGADPLSAPSPELNKPDKTVSDCVDNNATTKDLWDKAYIDLRNSNKALVDHFEKVLFSEDPPNNEATSRADQLSRIVESKLGLMEQKKWVINFAGKSVEVRKQVERLVKVVRMTKDSLSMVANIDPIHVGIPVAAICLLTPLILSDSQQRTAAIDGLSYIAVSICRFAEIEKLYLEDKNCPSAYTLAAETVKLYRSILEFQIRIICQIDRNTAHQFARNVVEADQWKEQLEQIRSCERACQDCMVILDTKERQQGMDCLESRLRDIDANFQQQSDALLSELKISREDQKDWNMSQAESECLETLRTVDYESDKSRIADRVEHTCEWFLAHEKYQSWLSESSSRLLWVTADPGCGKSVLSKFLVDSYSDNDTIGTPSICYFFFRDGSEKNQDGTNALCALLHQLFKQKRALLRHALPDFEHNKTKLSGLSETLWSVFLKAVTDPEAGSVICIIDALDECGEETRTWLLKHIGGFFSSPPTSATLKCIITSRPYTTIGDSLWEGYHNVSSVRLMGESGNEMSTIQREISLVIDKKVENFREKRQELGIHDETHHVISEKLAQIENRTYLWVSLIFPELDKNARSSQGRLLGVIEVIPSTVEEAYERILRNTTDAPKAQKLLRFVLAAQRPLTLWEMNTALATTEKCAAAGDLELEPEVTFRETVKDLCGLFISVNDSKVFLIHQTAREFLLATNSEINPVPSAKRIWMHSMDLKTSHFELAKTCLLYLNLSGLRYKSKVDDFDADFKEIGRDLKPRPIFDPACQFRLYSAEHWCSHAVKSDSEAVDSLMSLMLSITTPGSQAFKNWTSEWCCISDVPRSGKNDQLSIAVYFELRSLVKFLFERGQQPIEEESLDRAAICAIERCPDVFHIF